MGSEDLFHKRKAKQRKSLLRAKKQRQDFDKVLIVTEGEKTEPNYFENLKRVYKLPNADIEVDDKSGSSPRSVLERTLIRFNEAKKLNDPFDKVYCVFDRDNHETYQQTVNKIVSLKPQNTFYAITSVPCFEFWVLLHFVYSNRSFHATGKHSVSGSVLKHLRRYLPDYEKGEQELFELLQGQLEFALDNAAKLRKHNLQIGNDNPATEMDVLIHYLQSQRRKTSS